MPALRHFGLRHLAVFLILHSAFCILTSLPARAHEIQPAYLDLHESSPGHYTVLWKIPSAIAATASFQPLFPASAKITSPILTQHLGGSDLQRYQLSIPGGLDNQTLALTGPTAVLGDVLVRLVRANGSVQFFHINPATPAVLITGTPSRWATAATFLNLGVEHILLGPDHLLFVLGLLLIVPNRWMLLKTVTAFTLAHSITLAIATLGYASAPLPPLNAAIALSILFLGPEIIRYRRGQTSLTLRHPWIVAFAFGLLHGFGFASGLANLGLARAEIPWALLSFNVGVEIGQLSFIALVLLLVRSWKILLIHWPRWAVLLPPYAIGSLGAYWTIQRTWIMFESLR
jgi:hydrogenase/urease accessory protein HupE